MEQGEWEDLAADLWTRAWDLGFLPTTDEAAEGIELGGTWHTPKTRAHMSSLKKRLGCTSTIFWTSLGKNATKLSRNGEK